MTAVLDKNTLAVNGVLFSLTSDAYDYNKTLFTFEISIPKNEDNDGDVSGLSINATELEITNYLANAAAIYKNEKFTGVRHASFISSKLKELSKKRKAILDKGFKLFCQKTLFGGEGWYALLPGETEFKHENDNHNYVGFFSNEVDLIEEVYNDYCYAH